MAVLLQKCVPDTSCLKVSPQQLQVALYVNAVLHECAMRMHQTQPGAAWFGKQPAAAPAYTAIASLPGYTQQCCTCRTRPGQMMVSG